LPGLSIQLQMLTTKEARKCPASNNTPGDSGWQRVAKRSAERFPGRQSKPLGHFAKCMVWWRWSCKLQCLYLLFTAHQR
jgi:hypothetical protein